MDAESTFSFFLMIFFSRRSRTYLLTHLNIFDEDSKQNWGEILSTVFDTAENKSLCFRSYLEMVMMDERRDSEGWNGVLYN